MVLRQSLAALLSIWFYRSNMAGSNRQIAVILTPRGCNSRMILRGIGRYQQPNPVRPIELHTETDAAVKAALDGEPAGILACVRSPDQAALFGDVPVPVVSIGPHPLGLPYVGHDDHAIGRIAAEHFLERSFTSFLALIASGDERCDAFSQTVAEHSHTCTTIRACGTEPNNYAVVHSDSERAIADQLASLPKPLAVFATKDTAGLLALRLCRQLGLKLPDEVAVLGVHDDPVMCELGRPPLSSVRTSSQQIGLEGMALLERMIAGEPAPTGPILLPPRGIATRTSTDVFAVEDPGVLEALEVIQKRAGEVTDVGDILRVVPVSRRALERKFKALLGRTIAEEIRRVHLERAKWMLIETDAGISEIAERCGFSHGNRMANVFRETLGMSPTDYRRSLRESDSHHATSSCSNTLTAESGD